MTLVIPAGFAHVVHSLRWSPDPEPMAITYAVAVNDTTPPASATALADTLDAAFEASFLPVISVNIERIQTEVRWAIAAPPDPPVIGLHVETDSGGRAGATMIPQNTAFLVHKRSDVGGSGGRGRFYLPGVAEAEVDNVGNIGSATITLIQTALNNWLGAIVAEASLDGMVVLHDSLGVHAAEAPAFVTSLSLDPLIATQRRRLRR